MACGGDANSDSNAEESGKSKTPVQESIIGTWQTGEDGYFVTMEFKNDGTGIYIIKLSESDNVAPVSIKEVTWKFDDKDTLFITDSYQDLFVDEQAVAFEKKDAMIWTNIYQPEDKFKWLRIDNQHLKEKYGEKLIVEEKAPTVKEIRKARLNKAHYDFLLKMLLQNLKVLFLPEFPIDT